jgi:demethylmenaquinone methyltransferase/2-methoxy-6-polyprenyl-1,4-benzoquinol methylase
MSKDPLDSSSFDPQRPFGFQDVPASQKIDLVSSVFKRVAKSYDLMNDLMSLGIHRLWKKELIQMLRPRPHMHLLDMAGGTGDIAFRFLEACAPFNPSSHVTVCDQNEAMLLEGKRKAINQGILKNIDWVVSDAAVLPFADNTFDAYTISFGLRNVTEIEKALQEAHRVLKPGGQFFCLDFSKVTSEPLEKLYAFYSFQIIPRVGALVAKDKEAYQYLVESIARFPDQSTLAQMIQGAGFDQVTWRNLSQGIVAIHSGIKKR